MDDHIVQHLLRGEDEPPVEIEVSLAATASPASLLLADRDAPVGDAHDAGIILGLSGKDIPRDGDVAGAVFFGYRRISRSIFCPLLKTGEMGLHPALLLLHEGLDYGAGTPHGHAYNDPALCGDLEGEGFAAAVYDLIIKHIFHYHCVS